MFCFYIIFLAILFENISFANASEAEMPNSDFTQLVCGYLYQMDDKSEALALIKTMTKSKINETQVAKLEEIASSERITKDFCSSSLPRL